MKRPASYPLRRIGFGYWPLRQMILSVLKGVQTEFGLQLLLKSLDDGEPGSPVRRSYFCFVRESPSHRSDGEDQALAPSSLAFLLSAITLSSISRGISS